jgi:CubicO group peptidase (beta-lactamase class C family)
VPLSFPGAALAVRQWRRALRDQSGKLNDGEETGYGFGWFVGGEEGDRWVNHEGSYGGFSTYYSKEIDSEVAVLVLANVDEAKPDELGDTITDGLGDDEEEDDEE